MHAIIPCTCHYLLSASQAGTLIQVLSCQEDIRLCCQQKLDGCVRVLRCVCINVHANVCVCVCVSLCTYCMCVFEVIIHGAICHKYSQHSTLSLQCEHLLNTHALCMPASVSYIYCVECLVLRGNMVGGL